MLGVCSLIPVTGTYGDTPHTEEQTEYWRQILTGEQPGLAAHERFFRRLPSPPRCKLCQAPFAGPLAPFFRLAGFRRWRLNQQICRWCIGTLDKHTGGAEVPVSLLYADVRGSTALAEEMPPVEFTKTMNRFYHVVAGAVDAELGVIDHMAGDGVMAFWIPGFVDEAHPMHAVAAGRRLAADLASEKTMGMSLPVGVAVHTGEAYVGVLGDAGSRDFTVLGDAANTVARLSSAVSAGELAMSESVAAAANVNTDDLEHRSFQVKGKAEPVPAWIERVA